MEIVQNYAPVSAYTQTFINNRLWYGNVDTELIDDAVDVDVTIQRSGEDFDESKPMKTISGRVELRNLTFAYPGEEAILKELNLINFMLTL